MRRYILVLVVVALFAAPVSVAAQTSGASIDLGRTDLVGKAVVNVDVAFSCEPKADVEYPLRSTWGSYTANRSPEIYVEIRQAVGGRLQASGSTEFWLDPEAVCTGAAGDFTIPVVPDPSGPPFKVGRAAILVSGWADYRIENLEDWQAPVVDVLQADSTGWTPVRIGK